MISTKGRYALRVMLDLAKQDSDGYVALKDIAKRQGISKKYLEIIVKDLVAGKLLVGVSGRGGGYKLCRKPEEYSIGEILEKTEGSLASVACLVEGAEPCPRSCDCMTLPLWREYDEMIHNFFNSKTLADLIQ